MAKLVINSIVDPGGKDAEFVWLKALEKVDIGDYMLTDNTYAAGVPSNRWRHTFAFPSQVLNAGDWVQLRTRKGVVKAPTDVTHEGKPVKIYEYFMGLDAPIWNKDGDTAHLLMKAQVFQLPKA